MAVGNWKVYNKAKRNLINGTFDLDTDSLRMGLYKSTSNATDMTLTAFSQLTNVVNAAAYPGAKTPTVSVVAYNTSGAMMSTNNIIFSAVAGDITSIRFAVLYENAGAVLAWCALSTAIFSVTSGNTLTINNPTNGIFTLTGGVS